jgi:hypothetical protein
MNTLAMPAPAAPQAPLDTSMLLALTAHANVQTPQRGKILTTPIPRAPLTIDAIRWDGNPITHLSKSSFELFCNCPEAFRRRYIIGEKSPSQPRMVLGNMVDGALTWLMQQRIAGHQPELGDLRRYYLRDAIPAALAREDLGVEWGTKPGESLADCRVLGWKAILAFRAGIEPFLGRPIAAQRKLEFRLAEHATWCVQGYLDVESMVQEVWAISRETGQPITYDGTPEPVAIAVNGTYVRTTDPKKPRGLDYLRALGVAYELEEREVDEIGDYKVVNKAPSAVSAADDVQVSTYLAGREIEGRPADRFRLLAMCKPTKTLGFRTRIVPSYRGEKGRRSVLARFANAARSINAYWREFGADEPWEFADPKGNWKCKPAFCEAYATCAGGAGF